MENDELQTARTALQAIVDLKPQPFDGFPADWHEQIAACSECKRWEGHPIQLGICDAHRKPLWAREKHEEAEPGAMMYRMRTIARDALAAMGRSA